MKTIWPNSFGWTAEVTIPQIVAANAMSQLLLSLDVMTVVTGNFTVRTALSLTIGGAPPTASRSV